MSLPLTPDVLRAAYVFLCATAPFCDWNLPDEDDIAFKVSRGRGSAAMLTIEGAKTEIMISSAVNGHTDTVLSSMAHEMVHLHEARCGVRIRGNVNTHSRAFRKWAAQVCAVHGFDPKLFY